MRQGLSLGWRRGRHGGGAGAVSQPEPEAPPSGSPEEVDGPALSESGRVRPGLTPAGAEAGSPGHEFVGIPEPGAPLGYLEWQLVQPGASAGDGRPPSDLPGPRSAPALAAPSPRAGAALGPLDGRPASSAEPHAQSVLGARAGSLRAVSAGGLPAEPLTEGGSYPPARARWSAQGLPRRAGAFGGELWQPSVPRATGLAPSLGGTEERLPAGPVPVPTAAEIAFLSIFGPDEVEVIAAALQAGVSASEARQLLVGALDPRVAPARADPPHARLPPGGAQPLELGYVVLRVPPGSEHLRGHHRCSWADLLGRLGIARDAWTTTKKGYYIRRFTSEEVANVQWAAQHLAAPIPLDPPSRR